MAKLVIGNDKTTGVPALYRNINKDKFGATIDNFLGDVDANGTLDKAEKLGSITLTGVRTVKTGAMTNVFKGKELKPNSVFSAPNLVEIEGDADLGIGGMMGLYNEATNLTAVSMPNLVTVGPYGLATAFCVPDVTSATLTSLQTVQEGGMSKAFQDSRIVTISLPALKTVGARGLQYCFQGVSGTELTAVSMPELEEAGDYGFYQTFSGCTKLATIGFPKLKTIGSRCFASAFGKLLAQSLSFPALTSVQADSFGYSAQTLAFRLWANLTEIHFPAAIQSDVQSMYGYASNFGAANATIYFDL